MLHDAGLIPALEWLSQKMEADYGLRVRVLAHPAAAPESEQLRTLLFECARELLFNVVKHAGVKEAKLTLNISSDGVLSLVVSDAGMGFDMHETGANSKRNETSFGLFSIRERLSFLGGLLNIRSAPGEGTRVELSVPVGVSNTAASTPSHPENSILADRPSASRRAMDRPARVLVADDHKLFRDGIIALLSQEAGLTIVGEAADGLEAVKLARALKPDILILDVSMPKLNGIQVATQVSRELPQTCIIGLSMHEDRDMAKAMRDAGATAYLTKGGSSESFLELLRSLTILKSTGP
jgi:CheY-like chemotaxis protein/anti-sigma regulatory factor (Ser/Thr protein kinase)